MSDSESDSDIKSDSDSESGRDSESDSDSLSDSDSDRDSDSESDRVTLGETSFQDYCLKSIISSFPTPVPPRAREATRKFMLNIVCVLASY